MAVYNQTGIRLTSNEDSNVIQTCNAQVFFIKLSGRDKIDYAKVKLNVNRKACTKKKRETKVIYNSS